MPWRRKAPTRRQPNVTSNSCCLQMASGFTFVCSFWNTGSSSFNYGFFCTKLNVSADVAGMCSGSYQSRQWGCSKYAWRRFYSKCSLHALFWRPPSIIQIWDRRHVLIHRLVQAHKLIYNRVWIFSSRHASCFLLPRFQHVREILRHTFSYAVKFSRMLVGFKKVRFRLHILRPSNLGLVGVPSQSSPRQKSVWDCWCKILVLLISIVQFFEDTHTFDFSWSLPICERNIWICHGLMMRNTWQTLLSVCAAIGKKPWTRSVYRMFPFTDVNTFFKKPGRISENLRTPDTIECLTGHEPSSDGEDRAAEPFLAHEYLA